MKNNWLSKSALFISLSIIIFSACTIIRKNKQKKSEEKEAILLVTFGSSYEAPHKTFKKIDKTAQNRFPKNEIRWAFTSDFIIKKLHQGRGEGSLKGQIIDIDTPQIAIEKMLKEGYTNISVQSLHIIPGKEYEQLIEALDEIKNKHKNVEITIGVPLLHSDEDIMAVAEILAEKFKKEIELGPVCFMGHGTPHTSDDRYSILEKELKKQNPLFFVGTVEGIGFDEEKTSIDAIINKLRKIKPIPTTITISPLMSIVGDHANNDLNAITGASLPYEQSWRERLENENYKVIDVMKGLGDYPEIVNIWLDHLEDSKRK